LHFWVTSIEPKPLRGKPKRRKPTLATSNAEGRERWILFTRGIGTGRALLGDFGAETDGCSAGIALPYLVAAKRTCPFVGLLGRGLLDLLDNLDTRFLKGLSVLSLVALT
jgi:hypothetical protein